MILLYSYVLLMASGKVNRRAANSGPTNANWNFINSFYGLSLDLVTEHVDWLF